jgi:phage terminase large subunit-like protein
MLPAHRIIRYVSHRGVPDAIETLTIDGVYGTSELRFKSYDQRREAFQGTAQHVIWLDEECPDDIYVECLTRTMATGDFPGGIVMLTFTPLQGLTPVVLRFLPGGRAAEGEVPLEVAS